MSNRADLVQVLLHEPPARWPDSLQALCVDSKPMPGALREKLSMLSVPPPTAPDEKLPEP